MPSKRQRFVGDDEFTGILVYREKWHQTRLRCDTSSVASLSLSGNGKFPIDYLFNPSIPSLVHFPPMRGKWNTSLHRTCIVQLPESDHRRGGWTCEHGAVLMNYTQNPNIEKRWIDAGRGFVEDFQESLMKQHDEAMEVRSLEEVMGALTHVSQILAPAFGRIATRFFKNDPTIPDYNARRKLVGCAEDLSKLVSANIVPDAHKFATDYGEIEGFGPMLDSFAKFDKAIAQIKRTCPDPDLVAIDAAKEEIRAGRTLTFEEAFPDATAAAPA